MPSVARAFGGPTESLIGYAQAARTQGMDVHVAAPSVSAEDEAWLREQLPEVTFHFFASAGQHAYVVAPGLWLWLWQRVDQFDAVHIHGLFNPVSSLSAHIGIARGVPTVMRPFGTLSRYTFSRRSGLKRLYFALLDRPALRHAAAVHFTTEAERDEANRLSIDLDGRSAVVPPPWRGETTTPDREEKADRPTVLYMSRLHPKKNVQGLLRAWAQVVADRPDAQLWVAGDGDDDYVQRLHDTVAKHGISDSVSFLGFVSGTEKERVLREAWAFALPSHQENFGVAVLETVAAGLPVVISGEVQLRSFIEENDLGCIVDRTDPSAIAKGLATVLADNAGRRRVAEDGPRAVKETFSVDCVGGELRDLYESVIHN
ncbi:glycosyltransferase involved in cell wall biosynthesis [Salinibacter ruber]|uniref:glycosyltransferase n=1 Tax=Salinibacter ruber TaxID=146919 RepID=UPI002169F276|nr:glycosyltransferase [Salinibacter ruber]MCS4086108.1 glycosyltransferase involved in cell wall biosynthesis [Salinibacter ruber]